MAELRGLRLFNERGAFARLKPARSITASTGVIVATYERDAGPG
jgi:hypothetical protein